MMAIPEALTLLRTALKEDDEASGNAAIVALVEAHLTNQQRIADALDRIALAIEKVNEDEAE